MDASGGENSDSFSVGACRFPVRFFVPQNDRETDSQTKLLVTNPGGMRRCSPGGWGV